MKDIARIEEVEEIKDGIEFCDHMMETLQDEILSLRSMHSFSFFFSEVPSR